MKELLYGKIILSLAAAVAASAGVIGALVGERNARSKFEAEAPFANWGERYVDRITPVLQLIPEQAAKMRPVFERRGTEVNTLAQTTREQLRDIRERLHADLRSILRPEQWEQFLQLETRRLEAARRQTATPTGRNASTISSQR